jgi:hypothetical protein
MPDPDPYFRRSRCRIHWWRLLKIVFVSLVDISVHHLTQFFAICDSFVKPRSIFCCLALSDVCACCWCLFFTTSQLRWDVVIRQCFCYFPRSKKRLSKRFATNYSFKRYHKKSLIKLPLHYGHVNDLPSLAQCLGTALNGPSTHVPKYWAMCPSTHVPKYPAMCPKAQEPKSPRAHVPKSLRAQVPKYPCAQVPKSPSTQEPKYPRAQVPKNPRAQDPTSPRAPWAAWRPAW